MLLNNLHIKTRGYGRLCFSFLTALFLLFLFPSCNDKDMDSPDVKEGYVTLSLSVGVNGVEEATRAVDDNNYFEGPETTFEKMKTLRIIIVNPDGIVEHNRLLNFDSYGAVIADDQKFLVKGGENKSVYLFANEQKVAYDFYSVETGDTFPADEIRNLRISLESSLLYIDNNSSETTFVPMSEQFDVYVNSTDLNQSADFFITRAVSKFSFSIEKGSNFEGYGQKITGIRIAGLADSEYYLPRNTDYNPGKYTPSNNPLKGRFITSYDSPEETTTSYYDFALPIPVSVEDLENRYTWIPYLYFLESPMWQKEFTCQLIFDNGEIITDPVTLPNLSSLARNTHVKVNMTLGNENSLLLKVIALPWESETLDLDYSYNVGLSEDGALSFKTSSYATLDKKSARMVLKTYPTAAEGSFGIATPVGARWDAYIVSTHLGNIQFVVTDAAGKTSYTNHISGLVGERANFRIGAMSSASDVMRTAVLQVTVTLPSGTTLPVNVLQGWGASVQNLTIIQNPR